MHALILTLLLLSCAGSQAALLKINGSTTVNLPMAEAAEILRAERHLTIHLDTQGGSSGGLSAVADGLAQIGMSSKPLTGADRARYPRVDFHAAQIGADAVALIVSKDVWDGGVKAVSREQVRGIYEGRIRNWKAVGGPDQRIVFFNKEPGRGTWEVFAHWLYPGTEPPAVSFPEVGGNEEARHKVSSTRGSISQLSASWVDGRRVFALGLKMDDGEIVYPSNENAASGKYPMSRPLLLLTRGEPEGAAKEMIEFILSPRGQAIVRKHGYLSKDEL